MTKKQTKQLFRIVLFAGTAVSLFFVPWVIVRLWLTPRPDTVQQQVNDAMKYDLDGMIVYVDKAGEPPAFYSAGWNNRENKVPANPQSLFKIASISKLYVAVAVTKLACAKRLSLDDTLSRYFPELVGRIENADKINVRMMIQHRSGMYNLTDNPDFPWDNPPKNSREMLKYALDKPALFEPGEDYSYSNTNYLLLAEIIDKVVGYSHQQYIKEVILDPLKLKHTFGKLADVDINNVMSGYSIGWKPDLKRNNLGNMLATAQDVGTFLRALNDGSLLTKEEQAVYSSVYVYEHTGLTPGYSSFARYYKDQDMVVIQFVNTSGGYSWNVSEMIYSRIIKILNSKNG